MEDRAIVDLYFARDEAALSETKAKYGRYLMKIAMNILYNAEDSEESVSDTYLHAWNAMPPHRPDVLSTFLGKICRRLSIDMYRRKKAQKRGGAQEGADLILDELSECLASGSDVESEIDAKGLGEAISRFLRGLSEEKRVLFVLRYYHNMSLKEACEALDISEAKGKTDLFRVRTRLREFLEKEGYAL